MFGTPRYMSPEQAQGAPLDARSDLYSLGVLMFQMLAGRAPFIDDDAVVVMAKHIKDAPPELGQVAPGVEVPLGVESVVRRALEKAPKENPPPWIWEAHRTLALCLGRTREAIPHWEAFIEHAEKNSPYMTEALRELKAIVK